MDKVDNLIIGGGMTYTFAKAMGGDVGNSLVEDDKLDLALNIIESAKAKGVNLCLPVDSINADAFNNDAKIKPSQVNCVQNGFMGLDIGEETASNLLMLSKTRPLFYGMGQWGFRNGKFL